MRRPRLRTLLLLINLVILVLPLAGLWFLRLYESALIRQTQSELLAQAAVVAGAYRAERQRLLGLGTLAAEDPAALRPTTWSQVLDATYAAALDLADDPVLAPAPDPVPPARPAAALAVEAGHALTPVLRETQQVTLAALRIVDHQGVIVSTTGDDLGGSIAHLPEIARALAGEPASVMRRRDPVARIIEGVSRGSSLRVFVSLPVVDHERVVAAVLLSRTPRDVVQAIYGKRWHLLAVGGLLLAAAVALAIVASRLITQPLGRVVRQARDVAAGRGRAITPLAGPGTREVGELSAAVSRMAAILEQRADYIRSFAAHVSHEFKTPLAGAKGAVELLDDHVSTLSEAERRHLLQVVGGSLERLERLVRRLIDLARADMTQPEAGISTPLGPVLARVAAHYADTLRVEVPAAAPSVALPGDALDILLASLLDNVVQHVGRGSAVAITAIGTADIVTITLADDGPGISAANAARIFEPFFTTAREAGGTGLGLSIARAIVTGAGGTIALLDTGGRGAAFRLALPAG